MKMKAYAKLNILLNVHGKYFNGYHSIESIMLPINLYDCIDVEILSTKDIIIESTNLNIPTNEDNILYKCAKLFQTTFNINDGFKIFLQKNIPIQTGLGGESTDAACLMHFFNDRYNLNFSYNDIFYYGRLLSWDVPICYLQKSVYINDITNTCEILDIKPNLYFLVIKPNFGISTKNAFINLDKQEWQNRDALPLIEALLINPRLVGKYVHNCFIETDTCLCKEYIKLKNISKELGFDGVSMTGTGSCFFLVTTEKKILNNGYTALKTIYPYIAATSLVL